MIRRPPRSTLFPSRRSSDLEDAFHAFAKISCQNPTFRLKIAGRVKEEYFQELKLLAEELEVIDKIRSEEHTSELQSRPHLVCRLLLEKKKYHYNRYIH